MEYRCQIVELIRSGGSARRANNAWLAICRSRISRILAGVISSTGVMHTAGWTTEGPYYTFVWLPTAGRRGGEAAFGELADYCRRSSQRREHWVSKRISTSSKTGSSSAREDDRYKKARERDDSIKIDVKSAFREAGYPIVDDFIQGSLKIHTGIVPMSGDYDIDRALVIDDDTAPENPVTPKKKALDVLEDRGFKNAKIKMPCVTADYASDNVHIDFIIYKRWGDEYHLAVGKKNSDEDNREWSAADPHGLIESINDDSSYDEDDAREVLAQFRRLVRYLKRWRDVQFSETVAAKVYSIGLTVMVKNELVWSFSTEGAREDLQALRKTVEAILDTDYFDEEETGKYRVRVDLPVEPWRDIFDGSSLDTGTQLYNKLKRLKEKLAEVEELSDERRQCEILSELFGDDFEVPDPPKGGSKTEKAKYASAGTVIASVGA